MDTLLLPGQRQGETLEEAVRRLIDENKGEDLQLPHLSKEAIEALYAFGYGFYESGNYEKAMHFFRFLTLVDIGCRKHWMGLGGAYQMLKQYERALQCWGHAAMLDENDPYVHWHAAECFLALENFEPAKEALTSSEIVAKREPERYKALLSKLDLLKNGPKKTKKSKSKKSKAQ